MVKIILIAFFLTLCCFSLQKAETKSAIGFMLWDETDNCYFLPTKDTLINSCLVGFQTKNLRDGKQLASNWTEFLKKIRRDIDTLDRKNVPPGFANYMYKVHVVAVRVRYIQDAHKGQKSRRVSYYMVFENRVISFTSHAAGLEVLDIDPIPCSKK
jgi:hypothetical protein